MKKLIPVFVFLLWCTTAYAQQKTIDSLKKAITIAKDDTSRIWAIYRLGVFYSGSKPDTTLRLAQQVVQLSKTAGLQKGEASGLRLQGVAFSQMGNYPKALSYYLAGSKISESIGDARLTAGFLNNIGLVYNYEGDYRQAINYTLRSLSLARSVHNELGEANELMNLGDSYEKLNLLDSAALCARRALPIAFKLKNPGSLGGLFNNLGNVYRKLHQTDSALSYYRRAIPYEKLAGFDDAICETTLGMAEVFRQLGKQDSSLYYARRSIATGWHGGFTSRVLDASQFLTSYFKQQGKLDSAFRYQEVSVAAKDSLYSQQKTHDFQTLVFAERQQQQEAKAAGVAYQNRVRFYVMLGVIAVFVLVAGILLYANRQRKKANQLLGRQNKQIEGQRKDLEKTVADLKTTQNQLVQSAKMASLGELTAGIAHEIQNPLNFVNNFSEVNEEMLEELKAESTKPKAERDEQLEMGLINGIIDNEKKIRHHGKRADFIVKGMLEHSRTSTGERQVTNINVLADEFLKLSYHGLRAKDKSFNAELVTNFDEKLPKANIVQQDIGRVLINLFGNAFYAVNQKAKITGNGYKPTVEVSTAQHNGSILISVKDNGTGIPDNIREKIMQPFFTTKPTGDGTGLGLSLSYDIVVKGHGGKIDVESKEGEGSAFIITLPLN